jgi:hypothetical protein
VEHSGLLLHGGMDRFTGRRVLTRSTPSTFGRRAAIETAIAIEATVEELSDQTALEKLNLDRWKIVWCVARVIGNSLHHKSHEQPNGRESPYFTGLL